MKIIIKNNHEAIVDFFNEVKDGQKMMQAVLDYSRSLLSYQMNVKIFYLIRILKIMGINFLH